MKKDKNETSNYIDRFTLFLKSIGIFSPFYCKGLVLQRRQLSGTEKRKLFKAVLDGKLIFNDQFPDLKDSLKISEVIKIIIFSILNYLLLK